MPLNQGLLYDVARRPFNFEPILEGAGTYVGSVIPFPGEVTIAVTGNRISATILDRTNWQEKARPHIASDFADFTGAEFRRAVPGKLLGPEHYGVIESDGWRAQYVIYENRAGSANEKIYRFSAAVLEVGDTTQTPAAMRSLYRRAAINAGRNTFHGRSMVAHGFTSDAIDIEQQRMSIVCDWPATEREANAIGHAMSLVAGQTLQQVATEAYAEDGTLLWTRYHIATNPGDRGHEFFHPRHDALGKIAPNGWGVITEGLFRLLECGFPIEMVLYHLHHASRRPYDIESQHLVLAIHTAFEAWNREFGLQAWMGESKWKKMRRKLRAPMEALTEYQALRSELQVNIRNKMAHANETEMGWRQTQFFTALQIDVSDDDNPRALGHRNELLHNGYFLKRWRDLTQDQRQQRVDDIERLRRLALLIILKLASYTGPFRSPVTFVAEHVNSTTLTLPPAIAPPNP